MIEPILWIITLGYNIAATFVWRRTFKDFRSKLHELQKEFVHLKHDVRSAMNESANNRMDILATSAECKSNWKKVETIKLGLEEDCKSRHTEAIDMYNRQLNYVTCEWNDKLAQVQSEVVPTAVVPTVVVPQPKKKRVPPKPCDGERGRPMKKRVSKEKECKNIVTSVGKSLNVN